MDDKKITLKFEDYEIDKILELAVLHSGGKIRKDVKDELARSVIARTEIMFLVRIARQELGLDMREEDKL